MIATRAALLGAFVVGAGCRDLEQQAEEDRDAALATVEQRTGFRAPDRTQELDAAIGEATRALLADGLTEEEAVRVALLENRELRATLEELGVARADLARAALPPNPVVTANAKFFDGGTEVELGIAQSFLELLLLPTRRAVADARRVAAEAAVARTLVHHVFDVRRAFAELLAAERAAAHATAALAAARAGSDLMRELHAAGNATDADFTAEEIAAAETAVARSAAQSAAFDARERLNSLLGLWGDAVAWQPLGELDATPPAASELEQVETHAIAASLDLAEQRARVAAAAQLAGVRNWEEILAPAQIGVAAKRERGGGWGVGPEGTIPLPIFDFGQVTSVETEARLRQELDREVALAVDVRAAARSLRERARASADRAAHVRAVELPLHDRLVRETIQNYNAMQIGVFRVLSARAHELDAQRAAVEAARDARLARLDLQELLAGSLARERLDARMERRAFTAREPQEH